MNKSRYRVGLSWKNSGHSRRRPSTICAHLPFSLYLTLNSLAQTVRLMASYYLWIFCAAFSHCLSVVLICFFSIQLLPIGEVEALILPPSRCYFLDHSTFLSSSESRTVYIIFLNHTQCLWGWVLLMARDKLLLVSSCGSSSCKNITCTWCVIICKAFSSMLSNLVFQNCTVRLVLLLFLSCLQIFRSCHPSLVTYCKGEPLTINY